VSRSTVILVRSLIFNVLFYANLIVHMIAALPALVLPYPALRMYQPNSGIHMSSRLRI
jgi:hypothetical protein